jgi:hypothetical protein
LEEKGMTTDPSVESPEEVITNENNWVAILTQPDPTIPDIMVAPAPRCHKCGERMILERPFVNEIFLREYWKCYTPECKYKLQIGDDGNPIYSDIQKKSQPKQERLL